MDSVDLLSLFLSKYDTIVALANKLQYMNSGVPGRGTQQRSPSPVERSNPSNSLSFVDSDDSLYRDWVEASRRSGAKTRLRNESSSRDTATNCR